MNPNIVNSHRVECKHGLEVLKCYRCRKIYLIQGVVPGGRLISRDPATSVNPQLEDKLMDDVIRPRKQRFQNDGKDGNDQNRQRGNDKSKNAKIKRPA